MKAITIIQPWATLIAIGEKLFETRSWETKYRGPLAIHAGKKIDKAACREPFIVDALHRHGYVMFDELPTGVILATCNLTACWAIGSDYQSGMPVLFNGPDGSTKAVSQKEEKFGFYTDGHRAWELTEVKQLLQPIPAKGQLSLWECDVSE